MKDKKKLILLILTTFALGVAGVVLLSFFAETARQLAQESESYAVLLKLVNPNSPVYALAVVGTHAAAILPLMSIVVVIVAQHVAERDIRWEEERVTQKGVPVLGAQERMLQVINLQVVPSFVAFFCALGCLFYTLTGVFHLWLGWVCCMGLQLVLNVYISKSLEKANS